MKQKRVYRCNACGQELLGWAGKCPHCDTWGSVVEEVLTQGKKKTDKRNYQQAIRLLEVEVNSGERIQSGISEFDRVVGGGLVRDSVSILTAIPGAGKSTLLLELAQAFAKMGLVVLYITGEESESQIKDRALRIMEEIPTDIWLISTSQLEEGEEAIRRIQPHVIFLDSLQTMVSQEAESRPGSPTQTVECCSRMVDIAKSGEEKRAVILVGHMTKTDSMAGLRTLEHMVDTVLLLEVTEGDDLRVLTSMKNRFGRTGEIGLFRMQEDGIKQIENPSREFVQERKDPVTGSATALVREGSRFIAVEIESLVSMSFGAYPSRIGDSLRKDQLNTLVAILEQRAGLKLYDKNVIIKTIGGLSLRERDSDLAVIMSIASSCYDQPIDSQFAFVAEVGLTGELKPVKQIDQRLAELSRNGYTRAYIAAGSSKEIESVNGMKVLRHIHLSDVLRDIFD
ncbi:MAG: AAA family ATPase [Tissierellia bacterium]|nr:AAA family ATPase [Tissierellia bacterium]